MVVTAIRNIIVTNLPSACGTRCRRFRGCSALTFQERRGARPGTFFIDQNPGRTCLLPAATVCHDHTRDRRPSLPFVIGRLAAAAPILCPPLRQKLRERRDAVAASLGHDGPHTTRKTTYRRSQPTIPCVTSGAVSLSCCPCRSHRLYGWPAAWCVRWKRQSVHTCQRALDLWLQHYSCLVLAFLA